MTKEKKTMVHNYTLHSKLKINQHEFHYEPRMDLGAPEVSNINITKKVK
jgi:hypothetical protein